MLFQGGLPGKDVVYFIVEILDHNFRFEIHPVIVLGTAPLIMMSQNRQEEKDRRRAENDYKVNLKTEIMIEALYDKVNAILARQSALEKQLQEEKKTE